jgi:hypothetical protein
LIGKGVTPAHASLSRNRVNRLLVLLRYDFRRESHEWVISNIRNPCLSGTCSGSLGCNRRHAAIRCMP